MDELFPPLVAPPFTDRRKGLVGFGVFAIIVGALCALAIPVVVLGQEVAANAAHRAVNWSLIFPSLWIYGSGATALITLGVGSCRARRWARALILCLASVCLVGGMLGTLLLVWMTTSMETLSSDPHGQNLNPSVAAAIKVVLIGVSAVIYMLVPGLFLWFYRKPDVKLTCEARDPVPRWTDRCPLPVLAGCLLAAGGALSFLLLPAHGNIFPFMGLILHGLVARVLCLGLTIFSVYSARGLFRLSRRAWTVYLAGIILLWISSVYTFARIDLVELYLQMGLDAEQLQTVSNLPFVHGHYLAGFLAPVGLIQCGFVIYLGRYFPKQS